MHKHLPSFLLRFARFSITIWYFTTNWTLQFCVHKAHCSYHLRQLRFQLNCNFYAKKKNKKKSNNEIYRTLAIFHCTRNKIIRVCWSAAAQGNYWLFLFFLFLFFLLNWFLQQSLWMCFHCQYLLCTLFDVNCTRICIYTHRNTKCKSAKPNSFNSAFT